MNRRITLCLFSLLIIVGCTDSHGQKQETIPYRHNMNGNVKSVKQSRYVMSEKFGKTTKKPESFAPFSLKHYNEAGYEVEYSGYSIAERLTDKVTYKYDEKDNLIEKIGLSYHYDEEYGDGISTMTRLYKYDEKGNKIEEAHHSDITHGKRVYRYDEKGNKIEEDYYQYDRFHDGLQNKSTYQYDEKGNKIDYKMYDANGEFVTGEVSKYDNRGNEIEWKYYRGSIWTLVRRGTYKYDNLGNRIGEYEYDVDGNLIGKVVYKYDKHGNEIENVDYGHNETIESTTKYSYEYDKMYNWTERVEYVDGVPVRSVERKIEYYTK